MLIRSHLHPPSRLFQLSASDVADFVKESEKPVSIRPLRETNKSIRMPSFRSSTQLYSRQGAITLQSSVPLSSWVTKRRANVRSVLIGEVALRLVIADGEVRGDVAADTLKTVLAVLGGTTEHVATLPNNLGEVTPVFEVGHVWLGLTVQVGEPLLLAVVEEVGDDGGDVARLDTGGDVLAITTTVDGNVVLVLAAGGNGRSGAGKIITPGNIGSGVVGAVEVVVEDGNVLVGSWGGSCGAGRGCLGGGGGLGGRRGGGRLGGWGCGRVSGRCLGGRLGGRHWRCGVGRR